MTSCTLVIDTREKNVTRHAIELEGVQHIIKQISTGDYAIISPASQLLVVIERKSLDDFAASLKDGRHSNKSKLIDMRIATGCRIVYIIEGPAFPGPTDTFGEIPYGYIESSIFHLMIRDCVTVLRTRDTLHTAQTLARFVRSMNTLYEKHGAIDTTTPTLTPTLELLTAPCVKSDHDIVREMWSAFPRISVESADEYMKHWTIADIIQEKIPRNTMAELKMANGRRINTRVINSLTSVGRPVEIRLLSKIPGISTSSATVLVNGVPLSRLLTYDELTLSTQIISKSGRKLGEKSAKNILKYFNYKYTIPTQTPTPPPAPPIDPSPLSMDDLQSIVELL